MKNLSFQFVAASAALQAKGALYPFRPSRRGDSPSWDGHGGSIGTRNLESPITDRSFWQGRYALCELHFQNSRGEHLAMNDAEVAISRVKNIVSTQMVGHGGTVKEYISDGDYELNIAVGLVAVKDGAIVDEYPAEGIKALRRFLDEGEALEVSSEFLSLFDIRHIVVKSFSLTQMTESNYQTVNIAAVSDEAYDILSTDY